MQRARVVMYRRINHKQRKSNNFSNGWYCEIKIKIK